MATKKKLYRSKDKKIIAGLFGGLEEYLGIDANILRLVFILIVVLTGFFPGIIAYIIASFIVPKKK